MPIAALIGLSEGPDATEWSRIRATQLAAGRGLALFMLAATTLGAAMTGLLFEGTLPWWELGGWAALTTAVGVAVAVRRLSGRHRGEGYATVSEVRHTAFEGLALAVAWSIPPLLFGAQAGSGAAYGLWMILSLLMTTAAVGMAPLALPTLIFVGGVGGSVAIKLVLAHGAAPAGITILFTLLLMVACLDRARSLVVMRANELALGERNETVSLLLREFEDSGADWLWETDGARRVVRASPRFAFACGLDPVTIDGMPFLRILAGPAWETGEFAAGLRTLADKMKSRESFRDLRLPVEVDGEERWWELAASPRYDDRGGFCGFRGVGSDVTEQRASADKINRMARFDTLTGLPNRLQINETLVRAMTEAEKWGGRCAFMMIDLDRFKAVNDTLGHPIGDRLLGRVSERLGQLMDDGTLCGRLGGDEFAVVVRDARDSTAVEKLAQRIIQSLSRPYEVDQHTLHVGASVGVATGPRDGRTAEMLIRSADLALYRAKDAGRGVYCAYEPQLHVQAEERRVLEMALRQALEKNEMHLAYQPVVDAGSGNLTGFEALLRWTSPQFGAVSPAKFIPLAEEARLIAPIGEWVLRTACAEAARWEGTARVAVNVSPEQLGNPAVRDHRRVGARQFGPARRAVGAGSDRERVHARGAGRDQGAGAGAGAGRPPQPRRFRHGLFVAGLPQPDQILLDQDRPQLRPGREQGRTRGDRDHPRRRCPRQIARHGDHRRGRRDRSRAPHGPGSGLHQGAGLLFRPAAARRRGPRARQPPLGRRGGGLTP